MAAYSGAGAPILIAADGGGAMEGPQRPRDVALVFRLSGAPGLVREVLEELGWREYDETRDGRWGWNLWWKAGKFR